MQFSIARMFTLQLFCKASRKKPHKHNLTFDAPCLQKNDQHTLDLIQVPLDPQPVTLPLRHLQLCEGLNYKTMYMLFVKFHC